MISIEEISLHCDGELQPATLSQPGNSHQPCPDVCRAPAMLSMTRFCKPLGSFGCFLKPHEKGLEGLDPMRPQSICVALHTNLLASREPNRDADVLWSLTS